MSATAPFGDCKKALLQNTAAIQGTGALIGIDVHSQLVTACSDNVQTLVGQTPQALLGQSAAQVFGKAWSKLARLTSLQGQHQVGEFVGAGEEVHTVIGHRQADYMILEFEAGNKPAPLWWNHSARARYIDALTGARSVEQCVALLVDTIFQNAKLDRVMCYRFLPGWHGEVIHEACKQGVDGFLGLRFPAGDVPANVRQLYTLNWQRMIGDVDGKNAPLLYWDDEQTPLDMTYSVLRAVHPVHIKYLGNMGVQASLSLSLVVNGRLWGLVACHQLTTLNLGIQERFALEEIAKLVALHLRNLLGLVEQQRQSGLREKLSLIRGALKASGESPRNGVALTLGTIRELFRADGVWFEFEGVQHVAGSTPATQALSPLRDWLDLQPKDAVTQFDQLPETLRRHPAIVRNASGVMYIPLSPSDFLVLLRKEVVEVVNWAGQPASLDENDVRSLTPRNSFAAWAQEVRCNSEPWHDTEITCADSLRKELVEYVNVARLEQVALHDSLTGLANRLHFERRLQQEVRLAFSGSSQFAVHMIDLDKFKPVNDTLGHAAGDALLKGVADRLRNLTRSQDTIARLGGDEFVVIQAGVASKEAASVMADRIVTEVAKPYQILGHKVEIGASVGVAVFPADSSDESELMVQADLALYAVKKAGRNAFSLFVPTMRDANDHKQDEQALLLALEQEQFVMHFQPIVDVRMGDLRGLESFIRWNHPQDGVLGAEQFLPLVEKMRLGASVGQWVLEAVFKQQMQWRSMGLPSVPISVNISSAQFDSQDLLGLIMELGEKYHTGWEWLRLDIKEEAVLKDVNKAIRKLAALRDKGIASQLDNFGRGFVSLGFMTNLPFLGIKFHAAALPMDDDPKLSLAVLSVVRSVAMVMNAKLTITRVETEANAQWMRTQGIELLQGYAVGRPADAVKAESWLKGLVKT